MSRKHGVGWDNGNIIPIGKNLKSHSGRHIVNSEKAIVGKDIIINHAYHNKLQMQVYIREQREKKMWEDIIHMQENINQTVNSVDTLDEGE